MKKLSYLLLGLGISAGITSCSKKSENPEVLPPAAGTVDVRGVISKDTKWTSDKTYRLRGYVYVDNGATLTIEPGTQIVSNKDSAGVLIIYKNSKIMARGTADKPIVFTSNETDKKPGDLGGVVLVGNATGNGNHAEIEGGVDAAHKAFGGNNDSDNSGVLSYVRIEYAGKAVAPGDEVNGLSLYAVGSGTTVDHIQVIRGLDDAFEFFGGTVNCKYLIAYNCADDDFDMDDGYRGKIQFAVSIKDPKFTDDKGTSGDISNNFEVDNTNGKKDFVTTTPITFPILSNFTAIGPNNAAGTSPDYGYGMRWRRGAKFILANSIVIGGQKAGLTLDDDPTAQYYKDGLSGFRSCLLSSVASTYKVDKLTSFVFDATALKNLVEGRDGSKSYANAADVLLNDPFNNIAPNLAPKTGSPALSTTVNFQAELADPFFTKVNYVGAIDPANDWTKEKWASWNR
ncbi:MAG TPA: hypothetical protein VEV16_06035 [Daejeonella sp.]|nr:hypothetical protein [Daejeonella sp.]